MRSGSAARLAIAHTRLARRDRTDTGHDLQKTLLEEKAQPSHQIDLAWIRFAIVLFKSARRNRQRGYVFGCASFTGRD